MALNKPNYIKLWCSNNLYIFIRTIWVGKKTLNVGLMKVNYNRTTYREGKELPIDFDAEAVWIIVLLWTAGLC